MEIEVETRDGLSAAVLDLSGGRHTCVWQCADLISAFVLGFQGGLWPRLACRVNQRSRPTLSFYLSTGVWADRPLCAQPSRVQTVSLSQTLLPGRAGAVGGTSGRFPVGVRHACSLLPLVTFPSTRLFLSVCGGSGVSVDKPSGNWSFVSLGLPSHLAVGPSFLETSCLCCVFELAASRGHPLCPHPRSGPGTLVSFLLGASAIAQHTICVCLSDASSSLPAHTSSSQTQACRSVHSFPVSALQSGHLTQGGLVPVPALPQ